MICLILKQKISFCMKPICQSAKSANEQNKCFKKNKKDSSALIFLEEAADFGCWISLSNGHSSWRLFLTESVDKVIRRLSHFKIIPKSSSNCFVSFLFFKITNQSKNSNILFQEQLGDRAPECLQDPAALWIQSLQLQCVLFSGRKVHSIHSLSVPSGTCTCWWAVWKKHQKS